MAGSRPFDHPWAFFTICTRKNRWGALPEYDLGLAGDQFTRSVLDSNTTSNVLPASTGTITVPAGGLIEFGSPVYRLSTPASVATYVMFSDENGGTFVGASGTDAIADGKKYAGPLTIKLEVGPGDRYPFVAATYRITNTTGVSVLPSNAVVIPTSSGGAQIILESSIDLVTWTAATPGTYSSTTQNRFFRVRAVQP
jgi:hypothetical protein